MQHTGYFARVLFGVFNVCYCMFVLKKTTSKTTSVRCIAFGQEGGKIFDGL